jgi:hypothetical protein
MKRLFDLTFNTVAAVVIALAMSAQWLDPGPPEHQALQDVADAAAAVEGRP